MSKPAFILPANGHRHYLKSYETILVFDFKDPLSGPPDERPTVLLRSGAKAWLADEFHAWFADRQVAYKLGWNEKVSFFIRVPKDQLVLAKLTWGGVL